jgi:riboflavin kinase/FMN adenylyltransferase
VDHTLLPMNGQSAVYALGNFDGVHRGHQALIAAARDVAAPQRLPTVALTFAPHPRRYFAPNLPPFLLTDTAQKIELLHQAGADDVVVLPFDALLAAMPAQEFVQQVLLCQCKARGIVAGEDFRFGHNRGGDMARMVAWVNEAGGGVVRALAPVRDGQGQRYATSTARALLQAGQVKAAANILGRPWAVRGVIAHGDARGRTIGFPTANIAMGDYLRPLYGVYAVRGRRLKDGMVLDGVANFGRRPTVDGTREWLETHFFDFSADIYGEEWEISLIDLIRSEQRFDGLAQLTAAIKQDCEKARQIIG